MHRFIRSEILPDRARPHVRPVLYNSWEATEFKVNPRPAIEMATREIEAVLSRLAERCDDLVDSIDPEKVRARRHATRVVLGAFARGLRGERSEQ